MRCLCATTRRAARSLTRYYEHELRPANVTPAQFELLGTLSGRPDLPQAELADAVGVDQTTLSRNLKVMIARKWIDRAVSVDDRRQVSYSLRVEGRTALLQSLPHWNRAQSHLQQSLGADWEQVWVTLEQLAQVNSSVHGPKT